ncbi:MAG: hypothetical protein V1913_02795 [Fibrobacterota bacterium]
MDRLCFILLAAFCLGAPLSAQTGTIAITGTVFPDDTDKDGNPLSVFIEVQGKDDTAVNYFITADGKGRELLVHLYSTITAVGQVKNESGKNTMTVQKYTVVANPPEDLDDL